MENQGVYTAYVEDIEKKRRAGNATEHTYRGALASLLERLVPGITAVNEPKREPFGAPDYIITRQRPHGTLTIGYIEAKDVGKPLDVIEKDEQMRRAEFDCADGLATGSLPGGDERVIVLDPACGTGTFLYAVIDHIRASFGANAGMWPSYHKRKKEMWRYLAF